MPDYVCVEARGEGPMAEVLRLRAECYSNDLGRIVPPEPDRFDGQSNCQSFLLMPTGVEYPIGTIRTCVFSPSRPDLQIPAFETHPDEVWPAIASGAGVVQSTHFCIQSDGWAAGLHPILTLFREVYRTAVECASRYIVTLVRPKGGYLSFYRRLGFEVLSGEKTHAMFGVPTILLGVDLSTCRHRETTSHPRFAALFRGLVRNP